MAHQQRETAKLRSQAARFFGVKRPPVQPSQPDKGSRAAWQGRTDVDPNKAGPR